MRTHRNQHQPAIKTRLALLLASVLGSIGEFLPVAVGHWICDRCGDLIYALTPKYRRNVRSNLSHVTGLDERSREVGRMARRVFRNSARNFYDLVRVSRLRGGAPRRRDWIEGELATT